jgi:hypothetical protein
MIRVKTSRGEKFFANEGKNAITSQLDIMPEGGMTVRGKSLLSSEGGRKRLAEPCLLIEWGHREHPHPQEDSSHGP